METIRLWAIGHTGRVGAAIVEVKLAIAYQSAFDPLEFVLTPSVTGHPLFEDYSTPVAPWLKYFDDDYAVHTDGSTPTLSDGTHLPPHGVYGEGVYWQEFELGDFDNKNPSDDERYGDSPIADFIGDVPESTTTMGQINVYEIEVISSTGNLHDLTLHFDLYNHVEGAPRAKSKFAPFSHTADAEGTFAPSPTTLTGLLSMAVVGLFRRRRRARNDAGR